MYAPHACRWPENTMADSNPLPGTTLQPHDHGAVDVLDKRCRAGSRFALDNFLPSTLSCSPQIPGERRFVRSRPGPIPSAATKPCAATSASRFHDILERSNPAAGPTRRFSWLALPLADGELPGNASLLCLVFPWSRVALLILLFRIVRCAVPESRRQGSTAVTRLAKTLVRCMNYEITGVPPRVGTCTCAEAIWQKRR